MTPARSLAGRLLLLAAGCAVAGAFALPMAWLVLAPFDPSPGLGVAVPDRPTLANLREVVDNRFVLPALASSALLAAGTTAVVVASASLAAVVLSRWRVPGRGTILTGLLVLSSVVTGVAAMVPTFRLATALGLVNTRTGVVLVLAGGFLPTAVFILKDFVDGIPTSLEESARLFGATRWQATRDVVLPLLRPGLAVVAVWTAVNTWSDFLTPFVLLRSPQLRPASVAVYEFYTEGGQPDLALVSAFALLYTIPVVLLYAVVDRRYGFRFHGGIKG